MGRRLDLSTDPRRSERASDLPLLWMVLAGALAIALAAAAHGQTPEPPQAGFSGAVDVEEVLIDARVTDREGNAILGLRPEDFHVRVGGQPAEVTGVTFYSNRRYLDQVGAAGLGIDPSAVPDRRYFILFFDDQRSNAMEVRGLLTRQLKAAEDARGWLRTLQPGDLVAVLSYYAKLRVHTDFTADRERLAAAVGAASRSEEGLLDWPSRRAVEEGDLPSLAAGLPSGKELRKRTPRIYDALQLVAKALAPIPGRKNLLLYSIGFGDVDDFGMYRRDSRFHRKTLEGLNAANVAVYSIDLMPAGMRHPFRDALNDVAVATGGRMFYDVQGFRVPLDEIAKENNGYYLVAFRAPHPAGKSRYREIEVELENPEFQLTARRGYRSGA